jgi:hypothetical protein
MVGEEHLRPVHPAPALRSRTGNRRQLGNVLFAQRQFDRLSPFRHRTNPRLVQHKRGIRQQTNGSMNAGFMESIV